jgi:hypothetical protein
MSATSNTSDKKPGGSDDTLRDAGKGIDAPRLTPQGRASTDPEGSDETSPQGGAKTGQPSKAEG